MNKSNCFAEKEYGGVLKIINSVYILFATFVFSSYLFTSSHVCMNIISDKNHFLDNNINITIVISEQYQ